MAITLVQRKKIQQSLIFLLVAVLLITTAVLWFGFFKSGGEVRPALETAESALKPVEIDFNVLTIPLLQALDNPPEGILEPESPGRKNPFLPF